MFAALLLACAQEPILQGRGAEIQQAWLEAKVRSAAGRPLPKSRQEAEARQPQQRTDLMRGLGLDPLPERTPLHASVTGTLDREGYRIEKIAFQSRPDFWVTAHLYLPDGEGPFPVILNPHGHWGWKKSEPVVQARMIAQARRGYLAMIVDSPGNSFEGDRLIERRQEGTHHDFRLALSVGTATGVYVWDLMRALDYLETRSEADMTRVGITGASGGGTATVYTFAADERIDCAVPVVYATSLEVNPHNGCPCNHVPGTLRIGDRSDILALRAPAPVYLLGAQDDPEFPPEGTTRTWEKLRAIWDLYGAGERVLAQIFPGQHDYNRPMREAMIGFFDLHLRGVGDGSPVPEPEFRAEPPDAAELAVLPEWPAGARTMLDLARERLAAGQQAHQNVFRRSEIGFTQSQVETVHTEEACRWVRITSPTLVSLPCMIWAPSGKPRGLLFLLDDRGKEAAVERFEARTLAEAGFLCVAADLPGIGELDGLDLRLTHYLGDGPLGIAQGHLACLPFLMQHETPRFMELPRAILASGPFTTSVALLQSQHREPVFVTGLEALRSWDEILEKETTALAIQPMAAAGASLAALRESALVPGLWQFRGEPQPDWRAELMKRFPPP
jgi:dienelactone hydrolase